MWWRRRRCCFSEPSLRASCRVRHYVCSIAQDLITGSILIPDWVPALKILLFNACFFIPFFLLDSTVVVLNVLYKTVCGIGAYRADIFTFIKPKEEGGSVYLLCRSIFPYVSEKSAMRLKMLHAPGSAHLRGAGFRFRRKGRLGASFFWCLTGAAQILSKLISLFICISSSRNEGWI